MCHIDSISSADINRLRDWFDADSKTRRMSDVDLAKRLNMSRTTFFRLRKRFGYDAIKHLSFDAILTIIDIYNTENGN